MPQSLDGRKSCEMLSSDNHFWLDRWTKVHGRKPSVLLIGNIANNGYNNAKILSEAGFDCDVICYDYYHMMGCPEWEDADISGEITDDFHPDWTSINLNGFERPKWFAQGPLKLCIDYLCARRENNPSEADYWRLLQIYSRCVLWPKHFDDVLSLAEPLGKRAYWRLVNLLPRPLARVVSFFARSVRNVMCWTVVASPPDATFQVRASALITEFEHRFPDRPDQLTMNDLHPYRLMFQEWRRLFNHYDLIVGFSTDPILPLLDGKNYFAFEHGTLRTIPFENNARGRLTAFAYNDAVHCFVTNFDCAGSAEKLAPGRYTLINHPYDENRGLTLSGHSDLRRDLCSMLDADFLIFHPTRHDWVEGTGFADKSNEILLRAFGNLRARGLRVGLIMCTWGANVSQSKELLDTSGCGRNVHWVQPLAIVPFERMCQACDLLADQFKLGAIGGVVFKAMAVGTPIVTYLDEALMTSQYPALPPVINCKTTADIEETILELTQQSDQLDHIGCQSREWIRQYHGKRETINKQVDQFRLHLPITSPDHTGVVPSM